jgi:hypothetical protein
MTSPDCSLSSATSSHTIDFAGRSLPSGEVVPTIDDIAFFGSNRLTSLHFVANSPLREIGRDAVAETNDDLTLYVDAGSAAKQYARDVVLRFATR